MLVALNLNSNTTCLLLFRIDRPCHSLTRRRHFDRGVASFPPQLSHCLTCKRNRSTPTPPEALKSCYQSTSDWKPICWSYNVSSGCSLSTTGQPPRCTKGVHMCAFCRRVGHSFQNCKAAHGKKEGHWLTSTDIDGAEVMKQNSIESNISGEQHSDGLQECSLRKFLWRAKLPANNCLKTCWCLRYLQALQTSPLRSEKLISEGWKSTNQLEGPKVLLPFWIWQWRKTLLSFWIYQARSRQYLFNTLCTTLRNMFRSKEKTLGPSSFGQVGMRWNHTTADFALWGFSNGPTKFTRPRCDEGERDKLSMVVQW